MTLSEPRLAVDVVGDVPGGRSKAGGREFIALIISLMAMTGIAIDMLLPAFPDVREEFGMPGDSSQVGWTVTAFFLGMAVGPWLYGPISDRHGRRVPLFLGLGLYVVAAVLAGLAPTFWWIVAARFVWGLGSAAPRSLTLAMIRDRYQGADMARLMSMLMAVFLLVPILAPSLGAGLIAIGTVATGLLGAGRVGRRRARVGGPAAARDVADRSAPPVQPGVVLRRDTPRASRIARRCASRWRSRACSACSPPTSSSSELIVEDVYGYGQYFPLFFGSVAVLLAASSLNNARLVSRIGLTVLMRRMAVLGVVFASVLTAVSFTGGGTPNFWLFTVALALTVPLAQGLVPNANTAAMMPMPHVAGTASAVIGTISTAGGALLGGIVTASFDGTVRPFSVGLLVLISTSAVLILFGATSRQPADAPAPGVHVPA